MKTDKFFKKYAPWHTDITNDTRGVLGSMSKRAIVPYSMFRKDVCLSPDLTILVEYYHNEKPYFWGKPKEFPYIGECGPGIDNTPIIYKRSLDWFIVPKNAVIFDPLCFTVLQWEFEVTVLMFRETFLGIKYADRSHGIDLEKQYSKKDINLFLGTNEIVVV